MHSEMFPVRQNPIQRTVRTAHLSVLMTVCTTSVHNTTQNSSDNLHSYLQTNITVTTNCDCMLGNVISTLTAISTPVLRCLILTTWPHEPWPSSPACSNSLTSVTVFYTYTQICTELLCNCNKVCSKNLHSVWPWFSPVLHQQNISKLINIPLRPQTTKNLEIIAVLPILKHHQYFFHTDLWFRPVQQTFWQPRSSLTRFVSA